MSWKLTSKAFVTEHKLLQKNHWAKTTAHAQLEENKRMRRNGYSYWGTLVGPQGKGLTDKMITWWKFQRKLRMPKV